MQTSTLPTSRIQQVSLPPQEKPVEAKIKEPSLFQNRKFMKAITNGHQSALQAIKDLTPGERKEFFAQAERMTGIPMPKEALLKVLSSKDFKDAFAKSYEAAKANPEEVASNPREFVRKQIADLHAPSRPNRVAESRPAVSAVVKPAGTNARVARSEQPLCVKSLAV